MKHNYSIDFYPDKIHLHLNENLFGPSPKVMDELNLWRREDVFHYPPNDDAYLKNEVAQYWNLPPESIFTGNGGVSILRRMGNILPTSGYYFTPTWDYYKHLIEMRKGTLQALPFINNGKEFLYPAFPPISQEKANFIIICSPNNPTGQRVPRDYLEKLLEEYPNTYIIVDEVYEDFTPTNSLVPLVLKYRNLCLIRSFSKFYALAGLRIGVGLAHPDLVNQLRPYRQPFGLPLPIQKAAIIALKDKSHNQLVQSTLKASKETLLEFIRSQNISLKPYHTDTHFLLMETQHNRSDLWKELLLKEGFAVKSCHWEGQKSYIRVTIPPMDILLKFCQALKNCLSSIT